MDDFIEEDGVVEYRNSDSENSIAEISLSDQETELPRDSQRITRSSTKENQSKDESNDESSEEDERFVVKIKKCCLGNK